MALGIFSKSKPKKQNDKPEIVVDYREKNSLVPSFLMKIGCKVQFKQLKIGDYQAGNYVIERKTFSDLQSSILDKRIFSQMANLKKVKNNLLIIEGEKENLRLNPNAIRGLIVSITTKSEIPIIFSNNGEETAEYIRLTANKQHTSPSSLRPNIKFKTKEARVRYILEGFPGIGPAKSKILLKKFRSLRNIITSSDAELKKVIGSKTKEFVSLID